MRPVSNAKPLRRLSISELLSQLLGTRFVRYGWPIIGAFSLLYGPTYYDLAKGVWNTSQESHGPFIIIASLWILSKIWGNLTTLDKKPAFIAGYTCLFAGLFLYAIGRSQSILAVEVFSQIPVLMAILLLTIGWNGLRLCWFPLVFLIFVVPMPGWIIDQITIPLKRRVSDIVASNLSDLGYPVAQNGVVLYIAQYELLVADACSGINSLYSLSAIGVFYVYMAKTMHHFNRIILLLLTLPVAYFANILRVFALVLITYYFGDLVAQSFVHDFSGLFLFVMSLMLLFFIDVSIFYAMRFFSKNKTSSAS